MKTRGKQKCFPLTYFLTYKKEGTLDARKFMNRGHNLRRLNKFAEADKEFRNALSLAKGLDPNRNSIDAEKQLAEQASQEAKMSGLPEAETCSQKTP